MIALFILLVLIPLLLGIRWLLQYKKGYGMKFHVLWGYGEPWMTTLYPTKKERKWLLINSVILIFVGVAGFLILVLPYFIRLMTHF